LSDAEVQAIADEVGLELRELSSEAPPETALAGRSVPERTHFGLPSTLASERMLPALPNLETQRRIVRELERNLGGTGIVEQFDAGMAWANSEAEAAIDRCLGGARLVMRRSFATLARKRRRRGLIFGGLLGMMLGGIFSDGLFFLSVSLEPLGLFGGAVLGMLAGSKLARTLHERQMNEERASLEWIGERVHVLVAAESPATQNRVDHHSTS
jgi:hypothetical protein